MTRRRDVHVTADSGRARWTVTQGGGALSRHRTQAHAVAAGRRRARREHVELVVHGRDGRVRAKDSYGREGERRDVEH